MKRSWFGVGLLLALLAVAVFSTVAMDRIHAPLEKDLKQAADCALLGDWINAAAFLKKAETKWKKNENFREFLADHTPVEEVDAGFDMLKVYCRTRETVSFAACCADLAAKTAAVGEAHALVWRNLL